MYVTSMYMSPQIKDVVSDKKLGQMRLQFWRDAIDGAYRVWTKIVNMCIITMACMHTVYIMIISIIKHCK